MGPPTQLGVRRKGKRVCSLSSTRGRDRREPLWCCLLLGPDALESFEEESAPHPAPPPEFLMIAGMLEMEEVHSFVPPPDTERSAVCWTRCWKAVWHPGEQSAVGAGSRGSEAVITMEWMSARREWSRLLWERVQEAHKSL